MTLIPKKGPQSKGHPNFTEVGPEGFVASATKDSEAGYDDSPQDAATESNRQALKLWCLRLHKKVIAGLVLGLLISPLVAYGLRHWKPDPGEAREKLHSTQVYRASTISYSSIVLDLAAFVILLPEDKDLAFLSLSISVKSSNTNVCREIKEKKAFFRSVIYGVLSKAVKDNSPETMAKEQLKRDIIGALNGLLVTGTIDDVYFTEFLLV